MNPHFFQPLLPGFHSHLNIPVRFFMKHIEGQNENKTAKLRSDVSHRTWEVKMVGRRFTDGWEEFADDHDLRIGDFLVFRHEGNMVFHVTGFGPSCCNLQYASSCSDDDDDDDDDDYDIGEDIIDWLVEFYRTNAKQTVLSVTRPWDLPRKKKKVKNNPRTKVDSSSDHSCFVAHVTDCNLREDRLFLPTRFGKSNDLNKGCHEIVLMTERGRSWTSDLRYRKSSGLFYVRRGWRSFCKANGQEAGGFFVFKLVKVGTTPVLRLCPTESSSDITPVECSEDEKEEEYLPAKASCVDGSSLGVKKTPRARRKTWKASASQRQNCFVTLTLTPYSYKKYKLYLPLVFTRVNGIDKPGKIAMVDKHGVEWPTNLLMEKWKNGKMHLGKGFRRFCEASDVKVGDSFMLELLWRDNTPVLKFCSKVKSETQT